MTLPVHLTLLGYSPVFRALAQWASANGIGFSILTSPDQQAQVATLADIPYKVAEKMDADTVAVSPESFQPGGLAISFGARWIFRKPQIDGLFHGRLLNVHGTRLPLDRGGGGFSWRIMRGDRIGSLLLHQVDEGVDTGGIVATEDYVIPASARTTAEMQADYERRLPPFLIRAIENGAAMRAPELGQMPSLAAYYPRLHTPTHGWIDWSWDPVEIERFVQAFDDPFPGARTLWRGRTITVRSAQAHFGEIGHHPFQAGLVFRNNGRWLMVALRHGGSLIVERVADEEGLDLLGRIREGDRLLTPASRLDEARATRVSFGPQGLKTSI